MSKLMKATFIAASWGCAALACAGDLVYQPINPNFGGNPLNGPILLNSAQIQNDFEDPDVTAFTPQTALERFSSSLQSRLLSQVLSAAQNGETGSLVTDDFTVNIINVDGMLNILITDNVNGDSTTIEVSAF